MFLQILGIFLVFSFGFVGGYMCCAVLSMNNRK